MAPRPHVTKESARKPDRVAGVLAAGFVVLLLTTELVLSLPDVLSFRGILGADSASRHEPQDAYDRVDDRER